MVLVDTSIWSLALRRRRLVPGDDITRQRLAELLHKGEAQMLGVVRQELLSGIRERVQFEWVRDRARSLADVPLGVEDYELAADVGNQCRAVGVAGSAVDFLICAVAIARGWHVFTSDRDFEGYSRVVAVQLY